MMDDFEKNYPGFDWKNTPARKHPGGTKCPCPKHEYIREQTRYAVETSVESKRLIMPNILSFCPDHYRIYFDEMIPALPFMRRMLAKIIIKIKLVKIKQLTYMESQRCFHCKFGSGGYDKKNELPPV